MLAFGRDGILSRDEIGNVVRYVRSLSGNDSAPADAERIAAGKEIFAANCASCHGEDGKGSLDAGAPDLTDRHWIYGGDEKTIYQTVYSGRQGHMPNWGARLSPANLKILALYVYSLGDAAK
jgi:cytochrome c oxidase cbb3-type subunit 3